MAAKALTANIQSELFGGTDRQTDGRADVCLGRGRQALLVHVDAEAVPECKHS